MKTLRHRGNSGSRHTEAGERLFAELQSDHNVLFAIVFGSRASGRPRKQSDLDIAVYYHRPPEGLDYLEALSGLSDAAGLEVDLVVLNTASAFLRHQIMKTGVLLISKDDVLFRRFRERTIMDYDEYKHFSGMVSR